LIYLNTGGVGRGPIIFKVFIFIEPFLFGSKLLLFRVAVFNYDGFIDFPAVIFVIFFTVLVHLSSMIVVNINS